MAENRRDDRDSSPVIEKDSQINVVVNRPDSSTGTVDLMQIFHNMKRKRRVYAWVMILCIVLGLCAPLLLYQRKGGHTKVSSVVTLDFTFPSGKKVQGLTAPDGKDLDLSQLTSAYVLQGALDEFAGSSAITVSRLRDSIKIDRILTEDSRRQQEVAAQMLKDKNAQAYNQLQNVKLTYVNQFIVTLTDNFNLKDDELRNLLDLVIRSYNSYLAKTYADSYLPADEISIIDVDNLDIMESLDLLRDAMNNLNEFCETRPEQIRSYRSWKDGRSIEDLKDYISTVINVNIDYLYADVYANSIAEDRATMISKYQYQLRSARQELTEVNGNIGTLQSIIESYKPDQIYVDKQNSDTSKVTQVTTDYYNSLVLQLAAEYGKVSEIEIRIADLEDKMTALQSQQTQGDAGSAREELKRAVTVCEGAYRQVYEHMEEVVSRPFYTSYLDHTSAQGASAGIIASNAKGMVLGGAIGAFLALAVWFMGAFISEMRRGIRKDDGEEAER